MKLSTRSILIGLILGDGYLSKPKSKTDNSYLDIKYDEKYLDYLKWLHKELAELQPSVIKKKKKGYHQYRFYTKDEQRIRRATKDFLPKR